MSMYSWNQYHSIKKLAPTTLRLGKIAGVLGISTISTNWDNQCHETWPPLVNGFFHFKRVFLHCFGTFRANLGSAYLKHNITYMLWLYCMCFSSEDNVHLALVSSRTSSPCVLVCKNMAFAIIMLSNIIPLHTQTQSHHLKYPNVLR
jgi:hypothetical protein